MENLATGCNIRDSHSCLIGVVGNSRNRWEQIHVMSCNICSQCMSPVDVPRPMGLQRRKVHTKVEQKIYSPSNIALVSLIYIEGDICANQKLLRCNQLVFKCDLKKTVLRRSLYGKCAVYIIWYQITNKQSLIELTYLRLKLT